MWWCDWTVTGDPGLKIGPFMHLTIMHTQNVLVLVFEVQWCQYTHTAPLTGKTDIRGIIVPGAKQSATLINKCFQFSLGLSFQWSTNRVYNPGSVSLRACLYLKLCTCYGKDTQCYRLLSPRCHSFQTQSGLQGLLAIMFCSHSSYSMGMIIQSLHFPEVSQ